MMVSVKATHDAYMCVPAQIGKRRRADAREGRRGCMEHGARSTEHGR